MPVVPYTATLIRLLLMVCTVALCTVNASAETRLPYTVAFDGIADADLLAAVRDFSDARALRSEGVASVWQLRRRADRDAEIILSYLRSRGYYAATARFEVTEPETAPNSLHLRFEINTGPPYRFRDLVIVVPSGIDRPVDYPPTTEFGLSPGARARSADILAVEPAVLRWLRERGYPFPEIHPRRVLVDHATETVDVRFRIDPGPQARFGEARIRGLEGLREEVVLNEIPWTSDDWYRQQTVNQLRNSLYDTGLFAVARVDPEAPVSDDGFVPILFELTERKHRTIGGGFYVYTDEGVLGRLRWEDRNRRGLGNTLSAELDAGTQVQRLAGGYQVRNFRSNLQTLNITAEVANEQRDAFDSRRVGSRAWVERDLSETVKLSYGTALRLDRVTQQDQTDTFSLLSFPLSLRVDRSNDLLNPTRGYRIQAHAEPFVDIGGGGGYFLKTELGASHYWPMDEEDRLVIATRGRLGSILGASREKIPANERFYSGGGSSLRGYGFLTVSPLEGEDPIGGRSVLEASIEIRRAITNAIGVVAFVDAGAAYDSEYPDFGERPRIGTGLGVRYFSPIGPLRFDVGIPVNKRGIDRGYELYLSIGQAF